MVRGRLREILQHREAGVTPWGRLAALYATNDGRAIPQHGSLKAISYEQHLCYSTPRHANRRDPTAGHPTR